MERYHEGVSDWNFGKLSALRETSMALEDDYRWYYMGPQPSMTLTYKTTVDMLSGFYIHSCIKMRYKGAFRPTYVLGEYASLPAPQRVLIHARRPNILRMGSPGFGPTPASFYPTVCVHVS